MKKALSVLLTVIMLAGICAVLTSCPEKQTSNTVYFMRPGIVKVGEDNVYGKALKDFQDETGLKVKLVSATWMDMATKIVTQAAAGHAIDVMFTATGNFPFYVNKGYVQPLNKYVDLKTEYMNLPLMDATFKYDGKYYMATATTNQHMWCIFYNIDMLKSDGLDVPGDLYNQGKWTYSAFETILKYYYKDQGDGTSEKYGLAGWTNSILLYANDATFLKKDRQGKFSVNFDSQNLINGLEFLKKVNSNNWILPNSANDAPWLNQQAAMLMEREYNDATYAEKARKGDMPFEYGMVPLPFGPDNTEKKVIVYADGYAMGANCKNPEGGGKLINMILERVYEEDLIQIDKYSDQTKEIIEASSKNVLAPDSIDSGLSEADIDVVGTILSEMAQSSVASALASYRNIAEEACKKANEKAIIPVAREFTPFGSDFNTGNLDIFVDKKAAGVSIEIIDPSTVSDSNIKGDEKFEGKSVSIDADVTEKIAILETDPEVNNLAGWRDYEITFDYKFIRANTKTGSLKIKLVTEDGLEFGEQAIFNDEVGYMTSGRWLFTKINTDAEKIKIVITADNFNGKIVMDNFYVKEYSNIINDDTDSE